jgi:hypothetical protein
LLVYTSGADVRHGIQPDTTGVDRSRAGADNVVSREYREARRRAPEMPARRNARNFVDMRGA